MSNFVDVLKEQIEKNKKTIRAKRLLAIINGPRNKRRERVLNRLEDHAKTYMRGVGVEVDNDWSTVGERDWKSFFDGLLKFLLAILPLILPLFMK